MTIVLVTMVFTSSPILADRMVGPGSIGADSGRAQGNGESRSNNEGTELRRKLKSARNGRSQEIPQSAHGHEIGIANTALFGGAYGNRFRDLGSAKAQHLSIPGQQVMMEKSDDPDPEDDDGDGGSGGGGTGDGDSGGGGTDDGDSGGGGSGGDDDDLPNPMFLQGLTQGGMDSVVEY
ncbi:MAG: hypothetical protein GY946_05435 [bacterium]|nr:hypothetical protein [bacterium]